MQRGMNIYAGALSGELLNRVPKNVLAAIVVSFLTSGGDLLLDEEFNVDAALIAEWRALHAAGILPQRPPKSPA